MHAVLGTYFCLRPAVYMNIRNLPAVAEVLLTAPSSLFCSKPETRAARSNINY